MSEPYRFHKFALIVTGEVEKQALRHLFSPLMKDGDCDFRILKHIGQRNPITSRHRQLKMVGSGQRIPTEDEKDIGIPAHLFLKTNEDGFVILIDDLEYDRRYVAAQVFGRYAVAFHPVPPVRRWRTSVHFLVYMLEAYFLADAEAVNAVLETDTADWPDDVETERNPKSRLKDLRQDYREVEHGTRILEKLDVERVLSNPETCAALRTLFKWCLACMEKLPDGRFSLNGGRLYALTEPQINRQ
jgi:hypothetical protein